MNELIELLSKKTLTVNDNEVNPVAMQNVMEEAWCQAMAILKKLTLSASQFCRK